MADVTITISGRDQFSSVAQGVANSLMGIDKSAAGASKSVGGSVGVFGKLGGALGGVATVAGGIVAAGIFQKVASGIGAFAAEGLRAVGASQQLEVRLNSLFSANLMYESQVISTTEAVMKSAEEMAREEQAMAANITKRDLLSARMQEQRERIRQLTDQWGEEGLAVQTAKAKLADMERQQAQLDAEIAAGTSAIKKYSNVTRTEWVKSGMSAAEIQAKAQEETEKLTKGIEEIAKKSPFPTEKIKEAGAFAVQMGLNAERSLDLTRAMTNMGAALALPSEEIVFMTSNLKQMKAAGQLTTIDMREMSRRGLDLAQVIGVEMGMSVDEFNAQAKESPEIFDELIDALTRFSDNTFGGTVDAMAKTLPGMMGNMEDIVQFAARDFWTPIVDALQPVAQTALDFFDQTLSQNMARIGGEIASTLGRVMSAFDTGGFAGAVAEIGTILQEAWTQTIWPALAGWGNMFWTWLTGTVIPAIGEKFPPLFDSIVTFLSDAWTNTIAPQLALWGQNFFGWVAGVFPEIPAMLTQIVEAVAGFLGEQAPSIQGAVAGWTQAVFSWVSEAVSQAGQALGALLVAVAAWAMSGEAQTALGEMGFNLGQLLVDGIGYLFENQAKIAEILGKLAVGLAVGVAGLAGLLVVVGGQIVAGILAGILDKLGVELQPALFTELGGILSGIWDNLKTIVIETGKNIVGGISQGILDGISQLTTTLNQMGAIIMTTFKEALGIASPSSVFAEFGLNLVLGLIQGIKDSAGQLAGAVGDLVGTLFSGLGGGGGDSGSFELDFSGLLENVNSVVPEALAGLRAVFANLLTFMTDGLTALVSGPFTSLINVIMAVYADQLPALQAMAQATFSTFQASMQPVLSMFERLIALISQTVSELSGLGDAVKSAMDKAAKGLEKAVSKIKETFEVVSELTEAFRKMADAASAAARAAQGAGAASAANLGLGFQTGTGPLGFLVPPGFPNDSFPINVQSGERVVVTPAGMSMEDLVGRRGRSVEQTFYVNINTGEAPGAAAQSLNTLIGLASSGA